MGGLLAGITTSQSTTMRRTVTDRTLASLWNDQWALLYRPPPRSFCQLAYLPSLGGTVLLGSYPGDPDPAVMNTWLLKDGHWSRPTLAGPPPATADGPNRPDPSPQTPPNRSAPLVPSRQGCSMMPRSRSRTSPSTPQASRPSAAIGSNDDKRAAVVLFGGHDSFNKIDYTDTWLYNGTTWTQLTTSTMPPITSGAGMTYDRAREVVVLFGGTKFDTTWELSATDWTQKTLTPAPPARSGIAMAYDPKRRSSVLFSGSVGLSAGNDTWEYVDGAWRQAPTLGPPPRVNYCATYDEALEKVVVVSGIDKFGVPIDDNWVFGYE